MSASQSPYKDAKSLRKAAIVFLIYACVPTYVGTNMTYTFVSL